MLSHQLRRYRDAAGQATDANFKQVSLLLHGDGTNGAQNNTFLDSSTNNFTITRNGSATQGTNTPFSQAAGYWSNYFNGTSDYLTIPSNAAFDFGTGDWTVECWFYLTGDALANSNNAKDAALFTIGTTITNIAFDIVISGNASITGTGIQLYKNLNTTVSVSPTVTINKSTWYHLAAVKSSNNLLVFLNGVQQGASVADTTAWGSSTLSAAVGRLSSSAGWNDYFPGYISNLRLVKGTALYTGNFTPPTAPLTTVTGTSLLACQSNYFKDNSSNNFTITATGTPSTQPFSPYAPTSAYSTSVNGGSIYFANLVSNWLRTPASANLAMGTGDFTIECWIYTTTTGVNQQIYFNGSSGGMQFYLNTSQQLAITNSNVAVLVTSTIAVTANSWNHLAVSRSGTTLKIFVNGVQGGSVTNSTNWSQNQYYVGSDSTTNFVSGYVADLRVVKGTALYTANFTPPTAPLTAVTNTQLLLSGTNAGIFDNAIKNVLETIGVPQINTTTVKFGTGSILFPSSGSLSYLYMPLNANLTFGTGAFTIEFWMNCSSTTNYSTIMDCSTNAPSTGTTIPTAIGNSAISPNSGKLQFTVGGVTLTSTSSVNTGAWIHVACVRSSPTTAFLFINGTQVATSTALTSTTTASMSGGRIGKSQYNNAMDNAYVGYIDDLRITKGIARYTANFTPPTAAFPDNS